MAAQSIGDWQGTYRNAPSKGAASKDEATPAPLPSPRIDAIPVIQTSPRPARRHRTAHKPQPVITEPTPTPTPALTLAPSPAPAATAAIKPRPNHPPAPAKRTSPPLPPLPKPLPQWPLGLAALLGALGGWLLWRRKPASLADQAQDQTRAPLPEPAPAIAVPTPAPPAAASKAELVLNFVPTRFTATLTEMILRYRLTVSNHGNEAMGPVIIAGAMETAPQDETPAPPPADRAFRPAPGFSPHPHFTPDALLAPSVEDSAEEEPTDPQSHHEAEDAPPPATPSTWPECHQLEALHPGEEATFIGQMRLPLAETPPIRIGGASMVVPVVRLRATARRLSQSAGFPAPEVTAQLCVMVGESLPLSHDEGRGGGTPPLAPLRLDGAGKPSLAVRAFPDADRTSPEHGAEYPIRPDT